MPVPVRRSTLTWLPFLAMVLAAIPASPRPAKAVPSVVRLTVSDDTGQVLAGIPVGARRGRRTTPATTNLSGRAVFRLAAGKYRFTALAFGYPFETRPLTVPPSRRVRLVIPRRSLPVSVALASEEGMTPQPGLPVILLTPSGVPVGGPSQTGPDGMVIFTAARFPYRAEASLRGRVYAAEVPAEGGTVVSIPAGKARVPVLHAGQPAPAVAVTLLSPEGFPTAGPGSTDSAGIVVLHVPPGVYLAEMTHDGRPVRSDPFTVDAGATTTAMIEAHPGWPPPAITILSPLEGTVTPEETVEITGTVDDPGASLTVNDRAFPLAGNSFRARVPLVAGENRLTLAAIDPQGNRSETSLTVFSIPFTITSPQADATIRTDLVALEGTCPLAGTIIRGGVVSSPVRDGRFLLNALFVEPGENPFIIRACDPLERCAERNLRLVGSGESLSLDLSADPSGGAAPLTVILAVRGSLPLDGATVEWDTGGLGTFEPGGSAVTRTVTYPEPGTRLAVARVTDAAGVMYRLATPVTVHPAPRLVTNIPAGSPTGVAVSDDGYLSYTELTDTWGVTILDPSLQPFRRIVRAANRDITWTGGLTVDEGGYLWLVDRSSLVISILRRNGTCSGNWPWSKNELRYIAHGRDAIYAMPQNAPFLVRFDKVVGEDEVGTANWTEHDLSAAALGGLYFGGPLAVDDEGTLYVGDRVGQRIHRYTYDPFEKRLIYRDSLDPRLANIDGLAWSSLTGELAVLDMSGEIRLLGPGGSVRGSVPPEVFVDGREGGQAWGIDFRRTREGTLFYVVDLEGGRIAVILLPDADPLATVDNLRRALLVGTRDQALASFHPRLGPRATDFLNAIWDRRQEVAAAFEGTEVVSMTGETARCRVVRRLTLGGVTGDFDFELILGRDENNAWLIEEF
jgi:hypothetical protein